MRSLRGVLGVGLVAAGFVLAGVWLLRGPRTPESLAAAPESDADVAPDTSAATSPPEARPTTPSEPAREEAPRESVDEVAPVAAPEVGTRGSVVLVDEGEHETPAGDGLFFLSDGRRRKRVDVADGTWRVDDELSEEARFYSGYFDERHASFVDERSTEQGRVLRFRHWPRTQLRVVDAGSHLDLTDAVLRRIAGVMLGTGRSLPENVESKAVYRTGDSPFDIEGVPPGKNGTSSTATYWASAPGYAWGRIQIDHEVGGDFVLALVSGGDVSVSVLGDTGERARIAMRPVDATDVRRAEIVRSVQDSTEVLLAGVATGEYVVTLEAAVGAPDPVELARTTVAVEAGSRHDVVLGPLPDAAPARAEGWIEMPEVWQRRFGDLDGMAVSVEGRGARTLSLDEDEMEDLGGGRWRFGPVELAAGRWWFEVDPSGWGTVVDLEPGDSRELTFTVPEPLEVTIEFARADGGPWDQKYGHLTWYAEREIGGYGVHNSVRAKEPGKYVFDALPGRITLRCNFQSLEDVSDVLEIAPGSTEFRYELDESATVVVQFTSNGTRVPFDPDWKFEFRLPDGDKVRHSIMIGSGVDMKAILGPDDLRLRFLSIPGYVVPDELSVEARPGETTTLAVEIEAL